MKSVSQSNFTSVNDIFTAPNTVFVVPSFQRPYAWEERNFQDLLNDLEMGSKRNPAHHYLSSIHVVQINSADNKYWKTYVDQENDDIKLLNANSSYGFFDDDGNPLTVYLIIDGQQRLTSLFSLFFEILNPKPHSNLLLNINNSQIPRLILNPANDHYKLKELLSLNTSPPSYLSRAQKRLEKCFKLSSSISKNSKFFMRSHGLQMLVVELKADYGLQSFQTQNDRGKTLTNLERIKSLFMEYDLNFCQNSSTKLAKEINITFGKLYRVLDKSIEVNLFREGESGDNELIQLISTYINLY